MTNSQKIFQILESFQSQIEKMLVSLVPTLGHSSQLRDACEYALLNGGKRFRPALVLLIAKALNPLANVAQAASAVEFFHTASLIADDLPCMDNDDFRRNKPSLHKVYGESVALLASYALIAAGYELLAKNAETLRNSQLSFASNSDRICVLALENATYNTGLLGATGGQFLDINPPDLSLNTIQEVLQMKTGSLFEISFVLGWLYGGGDLNKLDSVKQAAYHFGMAFQIADDFGDVEQDAINGRKVNLVAVAGHEKAFELLQDHLQNFDAIMNQLNLMIPELQSMCELLNASVK